MSIEQYSSSSTNIFIFEHTHFIPIVGVGKERGTIIIGP